MNTIETILTRRSIRKYLNDNIKDEQIVNLLKAGMAAPSARDLRPWDFIVVKDEEKKNALSGLLPNGKMLKNAPVGIIITGDKSIYEKHNMPYEYMFCDCFAATENILLAAHELNLGAVWLGVYPKEDRMVGISNLFNLSSNILPVAAISIGVPGEVGKQKDKFDESKIHFDKW